MERKVYINGKLVGKSKAMISVFDHGFLYGDGVFEGIRAYDGCIFKLKEHIERLYKSAKFIMLKIPITEKQMIAAVVKTVKENKLKNAYIRLVVSRGSGDLGLDPDKCKIPNIIIIADEIVLYPEEFYKKGLKIITVPTRRNISEALNPQVKSLNYLNNILAKIEAKNAGVVEAIMLNNQGYVAECTGDNVFLVYKNTVITPEEYEGALKGITRDFVINLCRKLKIKLQEKRITRYDIYTADEMFLTGTAAEVIPVVNVDGRTIGKGKPGKITLKIIKEFRKYITKQGVKVK